MASAHAAHKYKRDRGREHDHDRERPAESPAGPTASPPPPNESGGEQRTITLTVPSFGRVANGAWSAALLPVAAARQILPAKKGLPLYAGLAVLGAADVLEWPVAIGIGIGYAVLRRDGGVLDKPEHRRSPAAPQNSGPVAPGQPQDGSPATA
ncbi:hypothetical protein ACIPUC_15530 [Streptomyces sp. LARHCF249]